MIPIDSLDPKPKQNKKDEDKSPNQKGDKSAIKKPQNMEQNNSLKKFQIAFNHVLQLMHDIIMTEGKSLSDEQVENKLVKIKDARYLWIDLMMQMQENDGVEAMSTPKYFQILDKLNKSMCTISKIEGVCQQL